ncbi:unnamed protein product [Lepeophtheirus salmonis]|uniref:(salmon louse) hypothetical protein n=1 Tax=Lepeophtheirus salmonis TaxID=72036 RepID=A0A7R8CI83_LEPSM|nr:unnamed protein product [Lepeophtheirus salmonis]CAF2829964.1 unnamed protein product [Lepeophtheirus salmonis]
MIKSIDLTRNLGERVTKGVIPVIEKTHTFHILVLMIDDDNVEIRYLGWRRIKKEETVRKNKEPITEPPLTQKMTDEDIDDHIYRNSQISFNEFPCYTQPVERMIKEVVEASMKVCETEIRDGFIMLRLQSRAKIPSFECEANYQI